MEAYASVKDGETQEAAADGMPEQFLAGENPPKENAAVKKAAKDKIGAMVGKKMMVNLRSMGFIT